MYLIKFIAMHHAFYRDGYLAIDNRGQVALVADPRKAAKYNTLQEAEEYCDAAYNASSILRNNYPMFAIEDYDFAWEHYDPYFA